MKEQILINFANGEPITDQRSLIIEVKRNATGGLYIIKSSFADSITTNGRKVIIIKHPNVGVIAEDENKRLPSEAYRRANQNLNSEPDARL
jgi:hypothetical protein